MVRIPLPHRLKSYGAHSASNSRSTSPNPLGRSASPLDTSGELAKTNGLLLKVVVLKVGSDENYNVCGKLM